MFNYILLHFIVNCKNMIQWLDTEEVVGHDFYKDGIGNGQYKYVLYATVAFRTMTR